MPLPYLLRCLGRPQLVSPSGEPVRIRVRKHLALLVYLALEDPKPHRRDHLAELLWPRLSPVDGRHSLATGLSLLRGKLGRELFPGGRDHVQFVRGRLDVDLDRLAEGRIMGDEITPMLEIGGFLEDFDIADAPEFNHWRDAQRARWIPAVRDALVQLIERCRRTGDFRSIEHHGNTLLEIDDLSEDGIRAKMEARAFDGDRVSALKIYQEWKERLAQELGAVPSPLVEGMAIRLRQRGWEAAPVSTIPTVPTDQWRGRPFIGRAQEYEVLYSAWESTTKSQPRHILVVGDSGIGKSTLMERLVTAAGLEGAAVSRVQGYELERDIPYAAVTGLIEGLLDRPGASSTPPEWLAELSRTVPEVRQRFPGIPESVESQGESARLRLTEALQQLVIAIADEHPVILAVDDIHLVDDASLAVLHLVVRRSSHDRVMLLMAGRTSALGATPHATRLVGAHKTTGISIVDLGPLSKQHCEALIDSALASSNDPLPQGVRRALIESASGVPMVLEYLIEDWQTNGNLCLALSIGAMTESPDLSLSPAQTYGRLLQQVTTNLDPTTHLVLGVAGVLGPRLNEIELYSVADVPVGQTMISLGQLAAQRVLREGLTGLVFSNELIRAEAYLSVPSAVRRNLHHSIADRLIAREDTPYTASGLEIAWHLIRSGRTKEATRYLLRGAHDAIIGGAPYEAERAIDSALGHLEGDERIDAQLLLAQAANEQGKWDTVLSILSTMRLEKTDPRYEQHLLLSLTPRRRCHERDGGDDHSLITEFIGIARTAEGRAVRIECLVNACALLVHRKEPRLAEILRDELNKCSAQQLSVTERASLAIAMAILDYHDVQLPSAIRVLETASADLASSSAPISIMATLYSATANVHTAAGHYEEAITNNLKAFKLASSVGHDPMLCILTSNIAMCYERLGEHALVIEWFGQLLQRDPQLRQPSTAHGVYHALIAYFILGQLDEAHNLLKLMETASCNVAHTGFRQAALLYLADCNRILGRNHTALTIATEAVGGDETPYSHNHAGMFARWLAVLALETDSHPRAAARVQRLLESRDTFDQLDKVEIMVAHQWLNSRRILSESDVRELGPELAHIPKGVLAELRVLRFME